MYTLFTVCDYIHLATTLSYRTYLQFIVKMQPMEPSKLNITNPFRNWEKLPACTNYVIYTRPILAIQVEQRQVICEALSTLGELNDYATCGVSIFNAKWGFVTIPPVGFTELKVNFYPHTSFTTIIEILEYIDVKIY